MGLAPLANRLVRSAELSVRPKVGDSGGLTRGRVGRDYLSICLERDSEFDADLKPNAPVPVQGHIAAAPEVLSANERPYASAAFGYYCR
jgi:hypothetical protein